MEPRPPSFSCYPHPRQGTVPPSSHPYVYPAASTWGSTTTSAMRHSTTSSTARGMAPVTNSKNNNNSSMHNNNNNNIFSLSNYTVVRPIGVDQENNGPNRTHHDASSTTSTPVKKTQMQQPKPSFQHCSLIPQENLTQTQSPSWKAAHLYDERSERTSALESSLKSPTTLSFERMLRAAKLLAEDSPVPPSHSTTLLPTVSQDEPPDTAKEDRMETSKKKRKNFKSKGDYTYSKYYIETEKLTVDNPFRWIGEDADLYQQVVLQMALAHDYDSKAELRAAATMDGSSTVISEGFFWRDYPVLERILFENMEDYYRASNNRHHTKHQQSFNTMLVDLITNEAQKHGLTFEYDMDEKKLRDRIRCFYKTHLQNAKKRLITMQKHPTNTNSMETVRHFVQLARGQVPGEGSSSDATTTATALPLKKRKFSE